MADFESRENVNVPRWGHDTAGVISGGVTEPPSAKKDTGWVDGVDVPTGSWWNWLHQMTSYFLLYIEGAMGRIFPRNHLARDGFGTTDGEVSAGAGLTVDVNSSFDWIEGKMYEVPAVVGLALAAADPTNDRIDVVVSQVVANVPSFAVVTGTPAASPSVPAIASNQLSHAEVLVPATAVVPGTITDTRRFGAFGAGLLRADQVFQAGEVGADLMFTVNSVQRTVSIGSSGNVIEIDDAAETIQMGSSVLDIDVLADTLTIAPEKTEFFGAIARKFDLSTSDFTAYGSPVVTHFSNVIEMIAGDEVVASVRIPNGASITAITLYGQNFVGGGLDFALLGFLKGSNVSTLIAVGSSLASGTGTFAVTVNSGGGLPFAVDQSRVLMFQIGGNNANAAQFWAADVSWDETKPFDGL